MLCMLLRCNIRPALSKICKARQSACRLGELETPGTLREGWDRDEEDDSEFPSAICDSDLKHAAPCYQPGSVESRVLRMCKTRRRACRVGVLETFGASQDAKEEGQGG